MSTFGGRLQREPFLERHHFLTFACVAGLGLGLTTLSVRQPERMRGLQDIGLRVFGPIADLGSSAADATGSTASGLGGMWKAQAKLDSLEGELATLRLASSERDALLEENAKLRDVLELKARVPMRVVTARVVFHERGPDWVMLIDAGSKDGIAEDQAVIAPEGVVGKVLTVTEGLARVQCVVDGNAGVAVRVGVEGRQADAVIKDGSGEFVKLRHVEFLKEVLPGDAVVTSGLDLIYPSGLLLGTVESVDEPGADREIVVRPAVDFSRLEHVLVIVSSDAAVAKAKAEKAAASKGSGKTGAKNGKPGGSKPGARP